MGKIQARNEAKKIWKQYVGSLKKTDPDTIAQDLGLKVLYDDLDNDISGVLVVRDASPVIFINKNHHKHRQRFTICHELGHYLLHKPQGVHVDKDFVIAFRDAYSSSGEIVEEIDANQFAAELLMPKEAIELFFKKEKISIVTDQVIENLSDFFEVSLQAATIRLTSLGMVK